MRNKLFKTATLLVITLLSITEVSAQKQCKYSFDKVDPMSGERVRRNNIKGNSNFLFALYRKANDFRFETLIRFGGTQDFIVPKGHEMNVKLGNGEIIQLKNADAASPVSYASGVNIMTNYSMSYMATKEQMEQMAKHGFTVVSTKMGNQTYTLEFKEKNLEKNMEKTVCMLED